MLFGKLTHSPGRFAILAFIVFVSALSSALSFGRIFPDSSAYLQYSRLGGKTGANPFVWVRPMLPLIASLISMSGLGLPQTYALANTTFVILAALVAYALGKQMFGSEEIGVLTSILFATAPTILWFGAAVLVDSPGYFFTGLAVLLSYRYPADTTRRFCAELAAVVGVIFRESVIFGVGFLMIIRAYQRKLGTVLLAVAIVASMELMLLRVYGVDPFVIVQKFRAAQGATEVAVSNWSLRNLAQTMINAFVPYFPRALRYTIYPILTLFGFLKLKSKDRLWVLLCFAMLSINAWIWPIMTQRYSFVTWPAVLPLIACGMVEASKKICNAVGIPSIVRIIAVYVIVFVGVAITNAQIYLTCAHAC
jgi:uncharacterized membrane protein